MLGHDSVPSHHLDSVGYSRPRTLWAASSQGTEYRLRATETRQVEDTRDPCSWSVGDTRVNYFLCLRTC